MMHPVGYKGLKFLKPGQPVRYIAGQGEHYIDASVTLFGNPGTTGCLVEIKHIKRAGSEVVYKEGDKVVAGALEIYTIPEFSLS